MRRLLAFAGAVACCVVLSAPAVAAPAPPYPLPVCETAVGAVDGGKTGGSAATSNDACLAATGVEVSAGVVLVAALIAGGSLLLLVARRRAPTAA
jgi:hypothetical protein